LNISNPVLSVVFLISLSVTFSCALFQKKNLRLTTAVEENLVPENSPWNILAVPVYLPLGITAGLLDVFIVHPISVIPDAAEDTIDTFWRSRNPGYFTKMGAVPFSIIGTPPFFVMAWSYHWFFKKEGSYQRKEIPKQPSLSYEEWKLAMEDAIQNEDRSKLEKLYLSHKSYPSKPETVLFLIEASKSFRKKNKPSPTKLLEAILTYPASNEDVRNYILKEFESSPGLFLDSSVHNFLKGCKYPDCRKAVLKKIQTQERTIYPYKISSLVELYFHIATDEEKEKFLKQIRTLE
jgi:hypothetical protein